MVVLWVLLLCSSDTATRHTTHSSTPSWRKQSSGGSTWQHQHSCQALCLSWMLSSTMQAAGCRRFADHLAFKLTCFNMIHVLHTTAEHTHHSQLWLLVLTVFPHHTPSFCFRVCAQCCAATSVAAALCRVRACIIMAKQSSERRLDILTRQFTAATGLQEAADFYDGSRRAQQQQQTPRQRDQQQQNAGDDLAAQLCPRALQQVLLHDNGPLRADIYEFLKVCC